MALRLMTPSRLAWLMLGAVGGALEAVCGERKGACGRHLTPRAVPWFASEG